MRLPIVPMVIAVSILAAVFYLFNVATGGDRRVLDVPRMSRIADIEGIETEVALSPDGSQAGVIADGDLWLLRIKDGSRTRLTKTPEPESFPAWAPNDRITFTRGTDTFVIAAAGPPDSAELFKANAISASWSPSGRLAFVRDRGLWITDAGGKNEKQFVAPDENVNITIHAPRFSQDSLHLSFIKRLLNLSGEIWTIDLIRGVPTALVADRGAEYPLDSGWILDGRELVYLTDRSGTYSIWHVNFADNTILPLTQSLTDLPIAPIGMSVANNRIVLPRHFASSNISTSDGKILFQSDDLKLEPAISSDGKMLAFTTIKDHRFEVWTAGTDGSKPALGAVGREARFAPDGFHLVYTHMNLQGNDDVWLLDIRNGNSDRLTDADELDAAPDASPDGRWVAFGSTRNVAPAIWILPSAGGKRLRINDGGYSPRFSPDSRSILFWNRQRYWTMNADGSNIQAVMDSPGPMPVSGGWLKHTPVISAGNQIQDAQGHILFKSDRPLWPGFDVMPDGRFLVAPIDIRETSLWAVDLVFKTQ